MKILLCPITNSQDDVNQKQVSHVPHHNAHSQCSRQLSDNNTTSAFRDDVHHSYLDVDLASYSFNQVLLVQSVTVISSLILTLQFASELMLKKSPRHGTQVQV